MPRTIGGLVGFAITATLTVIVGTFVYNKLVAPMLARLRQAA